MKGRDTGAGKEYTKEEAERMQEAFGTALDDLAPGETPSNVYIEAEIEWSGHVTRNRNGGVRATNLKLPPGGFDAIRAAHTQARAAESGKGKSYKAKGWQPQLRQLLGTKRGENLLNAAGASSSRETRRRWGLERGSHLAQSPGKKNREAIQSAYDELRQTAAPRGGAGAFARTVTDTLQREYGVKIRFRDIRGIHFRHW